MPQERVNQVVTPPAPPALGQVPGVTVVTPQMMSRADVEALRARGDELSRQINSAASRRSDTRKAMINATGADKAGLEQRLGVLDARIARLEQDIDQNGEQLASLAARRAVAQQPSSPGGRNNNMDRNVVPMVVVFTIFVLAPLAVSIARMFWRRGSLPARAVPNPENTQRLERMEQAIDTIAIEMERVSEGQRFITRILSEARPAGALAEGNRQAEPLSVPIGERNALPRY
ncbi:MAG: hypothetical protein ABIY52_13250 [Gemmatimonadaceae bacterium]